MCSGIPGLVYRYARFYGLLASLVLVAAEATAAVYRVDVDVQASGNGLSWGEAKKSIGEAISLAAPGDEIWVAEGRYFEAVSLADGISLHGGFAGNESSRTAQDPQVHVCIIDGSRADAGTPADHVVTVAGKADIRLDGFSITGGRADGAGNDARGSGLLSIGAANTVVVANCRFVDNSAPGADGEGGGVYVAGGAVLFEDCVFEGNAAGKSGGGWSCGGGGPTLHGCTFRSNTAQSGGGFFSEGSTVTVDSCAFEANNATGGGGGMVVSNSTACVSNSRFLGNLAASGGALAACNAGSLTMERCTFVNNIARSAGAISALSEMTLSDCRLAGNWADSGNGGALYCSGFVPINVINSVLVGNYGSAGGGVYVAFGQCSLYSCTVVSNESGSKGSGVELYSDATLYAYNVLFADNEREALYVWDGANATGLGALSHCFFGGNPEGDIEFRTRPSVLTGADAIEAGAAAADGTVDGPVGFEPARQGTLTSASQYDATLNRTTVTDANAAFPSGVLAGSIVCIRGVADIYAYVTGNTETTLSVFGNLSPYAQEGTGYRFLNVHLGVGSACIDRGASAGMPPADIDGDSRGFDVAGIGTEGGVFLNDIGAEERIDPDTDTDGWCNGLEALMGTNPSLKDTDGDGLDDPVEVALYGTDPLRNDSDGDWFPDGEEIAAGSNPTLAMAIPYPVGDVDHSFDCDATDVQAVINAALGKHTDYRTDIDLSGHADARDVQLVINAVLHPVPN